VPLSEFTAGINVFRTRLCSCINFTFRILDSIQEPDFNLTRKRGFLVAISAKMHPMDQTSMGQAYFVEPSKISGERYQRVTTCHGVNVLII
jgi:hypothetical protein